MKRPPAARRTSSLLCDRPLWYSRVRGRLTVARYSHVVESRDAAVRGRAGLVLGLASPFGGVLRAADPTSLPSTGPAPTINEVGGKPLKQWIDDLKHEDPSVREEAIRAIPFFGPAASEAVPALIDHINDIDASPRSKAILTFGMIKIEDKDRPKVIRALGERLDGNESQGPIRYDIALVLMGFGKDAKPALSGLLRETEDPSCWEVRRICLAALVEAGQTTDKGPDPHVTRSMIHALGDRAAAVRLQGVMGLAQMGRSADPQLLAQEVQEVRKMMKDRDKTVVIWAHLSMMALDKIDDADIDYLTSAAKQTEPLERVRVQAIGALGEVGTKEKKVVPTLVEFLSEKASPAIVGAACQALGRIGDPGEKAEKALIDVCKDEKLDEPVRFQGMYALAMIGTKGKAAIPTLIELLLTDKDPNVVMTACRAGHDGGSAGGG